MTESIRVVDRAVLILQILAEEGRSLGVTEIARRVRLGKSTTHRLLASLTKPHVVRRDPETSLYGLGFRLLSWTSAWLDRIDVRTRALPHLRQLREKCQETVSLNILDGLRRVAVERLETSHELRFVVDLGKPLPLHMGAGSKAMLAFLPEHDIRQVVKAARLGPRARGALRRDLAEIRRAGTAATRGERIPGSVSVSAPLFNHEARVIGSVSILSLAVRCTDDVVKSHRELVRQAAQAVSYDLGWSGSGSVGVTGRS